MTHLRPANAFDHGNASDLEEALLADGSRTQEHNHNHNAERRRTTTWDFRRSSAMIGIAVGIFIQFSQLGITSMVANVRGVDVTTLSENEIQFFSALWSAFTSFLALWFLANLRRLLTETFQRSLAAADQDIHSESNRKYMEQMAMHMECWFVGGAMTGVCLSWIVNDLILGVYDQILHSISILVVALAWCRLMLYIFTTWAARTSLPKSSSHRDSVNADIMIV